MLRSSMIGSFTVFEACALLACSSAPDVRPCSSASECPPSARCIEQACVENAPPVASVALPPAPLAANALLAFDASGSSDPDPDDSVTSWSWGFRAISAPCAPPKVAGTTPMALVRFACPGSYAVDLTVTDRMTAVSPVTTVTFDVVPYYGPVLVEAGADVAVDHACAGQPVKCEPTSAVGLTASAPGAQGEIAFEWSVSPPPGRELDSTRRVTFVPDRNAASPGVVIETDGTAISGEWLFSVEARDGAGVLGTATTRVSIGNRLPVVEANLPSPDHVFEGTQLSASGEIAVAVSDPDGDDIPVRETTWHHSGDGTSLFAGIDLGTRITFDVVVPYSSPSDAAFLIGGAGLERSVELVVEDVNGGASHEVWPIVVHNRAPALVSSPGSFSVDHSYDAAESAYEAVASLSTWSDPDGDPLFQAGTTGDDACAAVAISAGGQAYVSCRLPFAGVPSAGNLAGTHSVTQRISDFWAQAPPTGVSFQILNRSPTITSTDAYYAPKICSATTTCCSGPPSECTGYYSTAYAIVATVPSRFADPDGDPLDVQAGSAGTVTPIQPLICTPPECGLQLSLARTTICHSLTTTLPLTVSDGAASASGSLTVVRTCSG